jgi:putative transposase
MLRTYRYRLYPSRSQEKNLCRILEACQGLYNMALAERKYAYKLERISVSRSELYELAKHYRKTFLCGKRMFSQTAQSVIDQVDLAFQAFFRRVKAGEKPGFPRFKGHNKFNSFLFKQFGNGAKLDGRRLKLYGIGRMRVRWHRPLEGTVKTVRILRKAGWWYACFACEVPEGKPLPPTGKIAGIDVGISALLTISDGAKIAHPAFYRAGQRELRRLQRKLARAHRGSNNRRRVLLAVQRHQSHVAAQRADFLHKLSTDLIRRYDRIALEDLHVRNMVCNHHLSKSILDSGWSAFRQYLTYKAESAGREVAYVDPAYTSKCCSKCGTAFPNFDLSTRWVTCACGLSLDRDHNAALNILRRAGWDTPMPDNVAPLLAPSWSKQGQASVRSLHL